MTARTNGPMLRRRALRVTQTTDAPLYLMSLTARELGQIADISRISRDDAGDLIGYQRPEVRKHVQEITEYLDGDRVLFPNPIIIALPSTVSFSCSRGPGNDDICAVAGTLKIPLPNGDGRKPGWIVDGQQRALALSRSRRQDFPVPVNAFVADSVELQRDQFLRINNTRPLPRGLVTELLPEIDTPLPPRLSLRQTPAALCDLLNRDSGIPVLRVDPAPVGRQGPARQSRGNRHHDHRHVAREPDHAVGMPVSLPESQQRRDRLRRAMESPRNVLDGGT